MASSCIVDNQNDAKWPTLGVLTNSSNLDRFLILHYSYPSSKTVKFWYFDLRCFLSFIFYNFKKLWFSRDTSPHQRWDQCGINDQWFALRSVRDQRSVICMDNTINCVILDWCLSWETPRNVFGRTLVCPDSHPQSSASHLLGLQGPQQTPAIKCNHFKAYKIRV